MEKYGSLQYFDHRLVVFLAILAIFLGILVVLEAQGGMDGGLAAAPL